MCFRTGVQKKKDDDSCVAGLLASALRNNTCVWVTTECGTENKEIKLECTAHMVLINTIGSNDPLDLSLVEEKGRDFAHYITRHWMGATLGKGHNLG